MLFMTHGCCFLFWRPSTSWVLTVAPLYVSSKGVYITVYQVQCELPPTSTLKIFADFGSCSFSKTKWILGIFEQYSHIKTKRWSLLISLPWRYGFEASRQHAEVAYGSVHLVSTKLPSSISCGDTGYWLRWVDGSVQTLGVCRWFCQGQIYPPFLPIGSRCLG